MTMGCSSQFGTIIDQNDGPFRRIHLDYHKQLFSWSHERIQRTDPTSKDGLPEHHIGESPELVIVSIFHVLSFNRRMKSLMTGLQILASTGLATPTNTSSAPQPTKNNEGGGISPGASAGISIVTTIGLLAVIGTTFFLDH